MKQVATILSAELSGLQTLTEKISSEEISELMNEIHSMFIATIKMHHGDVNNFAGESIISVFQQNKSGNAKHAVDSSYELKDQFQTFIKDKKLDQKLRLKIGIATGNMVSTDIGTGDKKQSTIMGEAVNHASRICQFAEVGQILVDFSTHENTQEYYTFQSLEPIPLKGGVETLPIFELTSKKRKKLDLKTKSERKIISEMIGRSHEAEQLEGLIRNLIAGKGSIVNIVGKAGIGKSRLVEELKVQSLLEKVLLLEGRAASTGQNLSFHPITNLIKSWAGITEDDLPSASSEKLHQGIKHNTPEQADEIYAFIATMMGLPLEGKYKERVKGIEGEALEKLILKNLRDLIIAAAKDKPRIYLVEDAHWSDSSSITLFESLYKLSQNYPVMFINVMRPGYKETGDYILKYLVDQFPGDHTTININPLEEKESGLLIKNLLRRTSLPNEIHNLIIRKTEGNPFFIEEIIRSFIDEGIIEVKEGQFVVTDKIKEVNIPETINDAILSRVDKLDEKTRELLNTASVMGRNFYYKVLEEATDTIEELDERLAYLSEVQLITETKKKEEIEYLFKHALAQQLTYDAMMQQSRKDTHLKIARSIEKVFATNINEFYGTLAYHYEKAKNKEKTIQYLILAGDESASSGASAEALQFYLKAMGSLPEKRKQIKEEKEVRDLQIKIAIAYHSLGKNEIAVHMYEMIMEKYFNFYFPQSEKRMLIRGVFSMLIFIFMINNQFLFFRKKISSDFDVLMKLINFWGYAYIHLNPKEFALKGLKAIQLTSYYSIHKSIPGLAFFADTATLFNFTGISLKTAQKMIDFAEEAGVENNPQSFINFKMVQVMQNYFTGKWESEKDFYHSYNTGVKMGKYMTTITYVYYSGMRTTACGNYTELIERINILGELAESLGISYAKILKYRLMAMGCIKFGKLTQLFETIDEGINYIKTTGDEANLFMVNCMKVQAYALLGEKNEAKTTLDEVEKVIEKHNRIPIFCVQYLISKIKYNQLKLKEVDKGTKNYHSILKEINRNSKKLISKSKKNIATLTEAYLVNAEIEYSLYRCRKAKKFLLLAIASGEYYNARPDLSRAYFETGKFLSDPKVKYHELNGHAASYYLDKAKTMFEEMDLQWDLRSFEKFNPETYPFPTK